MWTKAPGCCRGLGPCCAPTDAPRTRLNISMPLPIKPSCFQVLRNEKNIILKRLLQSKTRDGRAFAAADAASAVKDRYDCLPFTGGPFPARPPPSPLPPLAPVRTSASPEPFEPSRSHVAPPSTD